MYALEIQCLKSDVQSLKYLFEFLLQMQFWTTFEIKKSALAR